LIRLENIERVYAMGDEKVYGLNGVNLSVLPGEYIAVMGPSGSGKSTLLNIIGLLDRPTNGRYYLDQADTTGLNDRQLSEVRRHRIGFIFQFFHLVPRLTAAENVELPLMLAGVKTGERRRRVAEALERLGLSNRARHRPDELSGGQRQRVAIARAIVMRPSLVLADEPTGNLDRAVGREVIEIIEQLNQGGMTLIMVTHDPELGSRSSRQIHMADGGIVSDSGAPP